MKEEIYTSNSSSKAPDMPTFQTFQDMIRNFYKPERCEDFRKNFSWIYHNGDLIIGRLGSEPKAAITQGSTQKTNDRIELSGLGEEEYIAFNAALLAFFYPENPLIGRLLFSDEKAAVFKRSDMEIPVGFFPGSGLDGLVFHNGEVVGALPIPFVICWNGGHGTADQMKANDPHRDFMAYVSDVAQRVDGTTSDTLLMALEDKWHLDPADPADTGWSSVVTALLRQLAGYRNLQEHFRLRRPYLLFAEPLEEDSEDYQDLAARRRIALDWLSRHPKWRLVSSSFRCLGIPRLENVCAANEGFKNTVYEDVDVWY